MQSFKEYVDDGDTIAVLEYAHFINSYNGLYVMTEGVVDSIVGFLPKLGLHVEQKKGIIQMLAKAGKNLSQFLWYGVKAAAGNKDAKEKVKEISLKVSKEELLDFLLKLDMLTLHMLTGPIHAIDALTGWHIWANVKSKVVDLTTKVKEVVNRLKEIEKNVASDLKNKIKEYIDSIKRIFNI